MTARVQCPENKQHKSHYWEYPPVGLVECVGRAHNKMSVHYLKELDEEEYAILPDKRILITRKAFESIADYTRSQPTTPSPGRIYRKNYGWRTNRSDSWYIHICEADPEFEQYVLHHPYRVELVDDE